MFAKSQGKMANWWTNVQQCKAHMYNEIQNYKLARYDLISKRNEAEKKCRNVTFLKNPNPIDGNNLYYVHVEYCDRCKTEYDQDCSGVGAKQNYDQAFGKYIETKIKLKNAVLNFCKSLLGR